MTSKRKLFDDICKELNIQFDFANVQFGFFLEEGEYNPISNKIKVDNCNWPVNLAHELRHVWQIQTGKLTVDRKWNGVKVVAPYGTEPWEIDAKEYSQKYRGIKMKSKIDPLSIYWASFNHFELRIPGQCVLDCSQSGDNQENCEAWVEHVKALIDKDNFPRKPTESSIRKELKEYGAWNTKELSDTKQNFIRLIWIAANNIAEDEAPDCSEPTRN